MIYRFVPKESNVLQLEFDDVDNTLKVFFKGSLPYLYSNVNKVEYDLIISADSVGKEVRLVMKGKPYKKIEGLEEVSK